MLARTESIWSAKRTERGHGTTPRPGGPSVSVLTGNQHDAEDAVQDAFLSVVGKIDTFRGDSAFGTWFYRIISNAAYDKIRRRPRALVNLSLDEALPSFDENGRHAGLIRDWSSDIDDPAVQTELRAMLSSAVSGVTR